MAVKFFYKNQIDVAKALNDLIDKYWVNEIEENILFKDINKILINNKSKIIKDGEYTTIIKQRCGKKRLEIIKKLFEINAI